MAKTPPTEPCAHGGRTDVQLVLAEDLLHAGADPADLDDEWLLAGSSRGRRLLRRS